MRGIDTNILVRFLVADDESQAKTVYKIFKKAEANKEELFVPYVVVLELIWVLESVYEISRDDILDSISELLLMPIFEFEKLSALQAFISLAKKSKYDLSDLLIGISAKNYGCEKVITFDKKASKSSLFELAK